jgi:hypothetical protein
MSKAQERMRRFLEGATLVTGLSDEKIADVLSHWFWFMFPWDEVDEWWVEELNESGFSVTADALETLMLLRDRLDGTKEMPTVEAMLATTERA